ncbi:S-layer homology domain-containing protein [uncultured Intestinimonas sp.]|uniref:S-layer homology domain-containing protein n=1 Tax=uncultured Intestinimonas sp. TaxID=1689265 RepID=UPI0025D7153E|nr:S-layer homology domain-containing protein [uncultured Intestinimonas sp.]
MKNWKRSIATVLVAALSMTQPGGAVLAGAVDLPKTVSSGMTPRATALDHFALEGGAILYYYWDPTEIEIHHLAIPEGDPFSGDIVLPSEVEDIPITSIKESAFSDGSIQTRVQTVTVPGSIKEIPDRLFADCTALQEVVFREGVERLSKATFLGCSSLTKIVIPASVTEIDSTLDIPEGGMFSSTPTIYGYRGTDAESFASENELPFVDLNDQGGTSYGLSLKVYDPDGNELTEGFTVNWYESGEEAAIATGSSISYAGEAERIDYEVGLNEELGVCYWQPDRTTIAVDEGEIVCRLEAIPTISISGECADVNGDPLQNVSVTVQQTANGEYPVENKVHSGTNGTFTVTVLNIPAAITYTLDGYYGKTQTLTQLPNDGQTVDLGTVEMEKLPDTDQILLSVKMRPAVLQGEHATGTGIYSFSDLEFTLYNETRSSAITEFEVQSPYLVLAPGVADAGDSIQIKAEDRTGQLETGYADVELDERRCGSAEIELLENGSFQVQTQPAENEYRVIVFKDTGEYVQSYSFTGSCESDNLPTGGYTLVFMQKTGLLNSIARSSDLTAFGLQEGRDYSKREIQISAGNILSISDVVVPELDEQLLYYTVPERTSLTASDHTVTQGRYILMRAEYEIDDRYGTDNERVSIRLPADIAYVPGVTLDGQAATASFDEQQRILNIQTGRPSGIIRFYVIPIALGEYSISASLSFREDGDEVCQPVGMANFEVSAAGFSVPAKTNQQKVTVSGMTLPESSVTVYDNEEAVDSVTSQKDGRWQAEISLDGDAGLAYHEIYAQIENSDLGDDVITTVRKSLLYSDDYAQVSKITMVNTAHGTDSLKPIEYICEFDFIDPKKIIPQYWYWPSYPTFSFRMEFDMGKDASIQDIYDVYTVTTNGNGEKTYVPMTYDEGMGVWVGTHDYDTQDIPVSVGASYYIMNDPEMIWQDHQSILDPGSREITPVGEDSVKYAFDYLGEKDYSLILSCGSFESGSALTAYLDDAGFQPELELDQNEIIYMSRSDSDKFCYFDSKDQTEDRWFVIEVEIEAPEIETTPASDTAPMMRMARTGCGCTDGSVPSSTRAARQYNIMYHLMNCERCIYGDSDKIKRDEYLKYIKRSDGLTKVAIGAPLISDAISAAGSYGDKGQQLIMTGVSNLPHGMSASPSEGVYRNYNANMAWINDAENWLKAICPCPRPEPGVEQRTEQQDVDYVLDPSGYVYEAVPSNRLDGVAATLYYQDADRPTGQAIWEASEYSQQNPVKTDANGRYAWFVPEGSWKVMFTKDGYVPADSSGVAAAVENGGWLPVPPPQFEVNVGMVSTASPAVEQAIAYNDRIEVVFSQYMDVGSVRDALSLDRAGQPAGITVEPLDAEYNLEKTEQYATRFSVAPEEGDCTGTIAVSTDAQNYAGTALEEGYTAALAAPVQRPAGIAASGQTTVVYKETAALTLTLQPGIAGKALEVEELTPSLLSADETTVTTDAYGAAVVTLTGLLPGSGLIRIAEPESGLSETISVRIVMSEEDLGEAEKPAPVTAALPDGTPVTSGMTLESGAQIALRTATPGAAIRYTLDDACPCGEDALVYTGPIVLTADTVLRAAALLDGVYSDAIRLELTVSSGTEEPEGPDDSGGSGGSGSSHAADDRPSVSTDGEGGTVTAGGGTVTIRPDEGYQIGSVTINGETVEIPADGILKGLDAGDKVTVSFEHVPEEAGLPFTDVAPGSWYYEAVQYVYENGMMNGTGGKLFSPNGTTSRAMIVTILHRMEGAPAAPASSFTDIAAGAYYEDAVDWAAENGIVSGVSKTSFLPDDPVTREQLAVILYRYARYKSYDVTGRTDLSAYTDAEQIGAYAADAMRWANGNGLITGDTSTTLDPKGQTTRAEAATILMRFCQDIGE